MDDAQANSAEIEAEARRLWSRFQEAARDGKGMRLTPRQVHVLAQTFFTEDPRIADGK